MSDEKRLTRIFRHLDPEGRGQLLAFAEFLEGRRQVPAAAQLAAPEPIPRPAKESVVGAIKRLSATYHMVDKSKVLHETSRLMSEHVLHGRAAPEVIDELELLFRDHYERLAAAAGG